MRNLKCVLTAVLILTMPFPVLAQEPRGIVAHTVALYTTYMCPAAGCAGDLVSCPAGQAIVTAKITYLFMEGVCDDGGTTACRGRLRGLLQDCLHPTRDLNSRGAILSITMQGKFRFCFDDAAVSDCSGTPPAAEVVGEGVNRMQGRVWLGIPGPIQASDELTLTQNRFFTVDGRRVRIDSIITTYNAILQPDLFFNNCGGTGCGLAGTAVSTMSR
jgi:hypothetical protein